MLIVNYDAYPTLARFHSEYNKYNKRFVAGPPGSGKSVGNVVELLAIALRQEPTPEGIRPTRFGIIRSTYGELEQTTLKTLEAWLPKEFTKINRSKPIKVRTRIPLPDKTIADISFELIAIETVDDLSKLDSFEVTAMWLNEMTGLPKELVGKAGERVGRYPPSNMWSDGNNHCTYYGVIGDYNYPSKDHWLVSYLHEGKLPPDTMLYEQPPALLEHVDPDTGEITYELNKEAENLVNLDNGKKYLIDLDTYTSTGDYDFIQTRLLCRYGKAGGGGKAVFSNFDREIHVSEKPIEPQKLTDTIISIDTSGIHPCALFWQYFRSKWQITDGIYGEDMGLEEFISDVMTPMVTTRYPGCKILCVCDPANARDSRTAVTPIDLLIENNFDAIPAITNSFKPRIQACETLFSRGDKSGVIISNHVTELVDALSGGYQYRRLRATGIDTVYSSQPLKNKYSHWADAFQYGALHIISSVTSEDTINLAKRIAKASYRRGMR